MNCARIQQGFFKNRMNDFLFFRKHSANHIRAKFKKKYLRSIYKPHSVHDAWFRYERKSTALFNHHAPLCDHLSGRRVSAPLDAAYPGLTQSPCERVRMKTSRLPPSADDFVPAWPCSRRGLPGHPHYCRCRWSLTPPFHSYSLTPCPSPDGRGAQG